MRGQGVLKTYSGLPKSIYILFVARIINSMGNFVFPLLTMLLTDRIGLSERTAGIFVTIVAFAYVPGSLLGGKLADHLGRKRVLIFSQALAALCFVPCAFLGNSMAIPYLLILSALFNGAAQPANSAMVADLTNKENRKAAFSLLYLGINIGFSIGPAIGGFLYKDYLFWLFIGNAIAALTAIALLAKYVPETKPDTSIEINEEVDEDEKAEGGSVFALLLRRPVMLAFAILSTVYSFAYSQGNFSTTLQVKEIFTNDPSRVVGFLQAVNGIVVITMTTLIVHLTKRFKPIFNIALAGVFFAVGFGIQFFISSVPMFVLSTIVWTIGEILNATNSGVYIADHSPMSHRGRFNSIMSMITGAGFAIGPMIMGGYAQNYGVRMVWPLVFTVTMIAAVLMYVLYLVGDKNKKSSNNIA